MKTAEGNDDDERDDVDARFAALIRDDFGTELRPGRAPHERRRPLAPPPSRDVRPPATGDDRPAGPRDADVTLFDAWDRADAELDEREGTDYRPAPLPPMRRWGALPTIGVVLAVAGLAVALTGVVVQLPGWVGALGALGLSVGLSALLVAAFRRRGGPDGIDRDDNGAVV